MKKFVQRIGLDRLWNNSFVAVTLGAFVGYRLNHALLNGFNLLPVMLGTFSCIGLGWYFCSVHYKNEINRPCDK